MAKSTQGAFRVPGGFKIQNPYPVDDRMVVNNDNDLINATELPDVYQGIIVYSKESKKHYKWNGFDRTKLSNWESIGNQKKYGLQGQSYRITNNNSNDVIAADSLKIGNYVRNQEELNLMLANPDSKISFETVLSTWTKFSHNNLNELPANLGETTQWNYDSINKELSATINSTSHIGYISDVPLLNYKLNARLFSTVLADNDKIGIVIAFVEDPNDLIANEAFGLNPEIYPDLNTSDEFIPNQHTLTLFRSRKGPTESYFVVYNYEKSDSKIIENGSNLVSNTTDNWGTSYVDVQVERTKNTINVYTLNFSDLAQNVNFEDTKITIDLESDNDLKRFIGACRYGFSTHDQNGASFKNISIKGSGNNEIYDLEKRNVWTLDSNEDWVIDPLRKTDQEILNKTLLYNKVLKTIVWYNTSKNFVKLTQEEFSSSEVFYFIVTPNTTNLNTVNNASDFSIKNPENALMVFTYYDGNDLTQANIIDTKRFKLITAPNSQTGDYNTNRLISGTFGTNGQTLVESNFQLIYEKQTTSSDISNIAQTIDLGNITPSATVWDFINASTESYELENPNVNLNIVKGIVDDKTVEYLYKGSGNIYGSAFETLAENDLQLLNRDEDIISQKDYSFDSYVKLTSSSLSSFLINQQNFCLLKTTNNNNLYFAHKSSLNLNLNGCRIKLSETGQVSDLNLGTEENDFIYYLVPNTFEKDSTGVGTFTYWRKIILADTENIKDNAVTSNKIAANNVTETKLAIAVRNKLNTQPDWSQNNQTALDFIKNKPSSLDGVGIQSTVNNNDGTFTITYTDETTFTTSDLTGPQGVRGPKGENGAPGIQGFPGPPGEDGAIGPQGEQGIQGEVGPKGDQGDDGLTSYQVWLANGNTGTVQDYLDSLVGADGTNGTDGNDGATGATGPQGETGAAGEDATARTNKTVTASSYILLATDVDKFLIFSNACTVVVPNGLAANLEFQGKQGGTGQVTFSAESGGTLNVPSVFLAETAEQHCFFGIRTDGGDGSTILGTLKLA